MNKLHEIPGSNNASFRQAYYYPQYYDIGGFLTKVGQGYGLGSAGTGTAGGVISATGNVVGGALGNAISGGMTSGAGNLFNGLSNVASAIPGPWGAIIGGGLKVVGGLTNRVFGSKINNQAVADMRNLNKQQFNFNVDQSSNEALLKSAFQLNLLKQVSKSDVGKDGPFSKKASKMTAQINNQREDSNLMAVNTMNMGTENVDNMNDDNIARNYNAYGGMMPSIQSQLGYNFNPSVQYAIGGPLLTDGGIFDNGIKYIDAGFSHERNPNGGVPVSMNPNGQPNMVEEGETVWNNFVFSNRLKPLGAELLKNNLAQKLEGKTYAEISRNLTEEYKESPNDPILKTTSDKLLATLAEMQEGQKSLESATTAALQNVDPQEGNIQDNSVQNNSVQNNTVQDNSVQNTPEQADENQMNDSTDNPDENTFAMGGQMNTAKTAMAFFMNKGLSQTAATGLVANFMRESNLNPKAVNSSSGAYGIAQWLGSRKKNLFNTYGKNPSLQDQLNFVWSELNSTHKDGLKALQNSKTVNDAAINGFGYYEFKGGPKSAIKAMNNSGQEGNKALLKGINYARTLAGLGKISAKDIDESLLAQSPQENSSNQYSPMDFPQAQNSMDLLNELRGARISPQVSSYNPYDVKVDNSSIDDNYNNLARILGIQNDNQNSQENQSFAKGGQTYNTGSFKQGDWLSNWNQYVQPTLYNQLLANSQNYNQAADYSQKLNNLTNLYFNAKDYSLRPTATVNDATRANQAAFQTLGLNTGFGNIDSNINVPKGAHTNDKFNTYVDGLAGPRTSLRVPGLSQNYNDIRNKLMNTSMNVFIDPSKEIKNSKGTTLNYGLHYEPWNYNALNDSLKSKFSMKDELKNSLQSLNKKVLATKSKSTPTSTSTSKGDLPTWMRYAPAVGAGIGVASDLLGLTNKPDYSMVDKLEALANKGDYSPVTAKPLGNYMQYNPMDYNYALNLLHSQAGATRNAIRDNANGNQSLANQALLAADYNANTQEGMLYRQGLEYNDSLRKMVAEYNRGTDQYNSSSDLQAQMANQQALAALRNFQLQGLSQAAALRDLLDARTSAARSTNLTNFFNNIGAIGQDNMNRNMTKDIFDYNLGRNGRVTFS